MSDFHDDLSSSIHEEIIRRISRQDDNWKQIFSSTVTRVGAWDWPRPDYIISDETNDWLIASEFKPPGWDNGEYVRGLGQTITYLGKHHYSMLVIPETSNDGFKIGKYVKEILNSGVLKGLPICLVVYDPVGVGKDVAGSISLEVPIQVPRTTEITSKATTNRTYWTFWRDTSNYEVYELLKLSNKYDDHSGDIYTDKIFPQFWQKKCNGETKNWEGQPRKIKSKEKMKSSEKQNNKIPLFHIGLWNQADGKLTLKGLKLLNVGKLYGADSRQFLDFLAKLVLVDGKHLDLINHIQQFQYDDNAIQQINNSNQFYKKLDDYLESKKLIGKRKLGRRTTGAKQTFLRDEPKLWKKLGLVVAKNEKEYFFSKKGFKFNWERISKVLSTDFSKF